MNLAAAQNNHNHNRLKCLRNFYMQYETPYYHCTTKQTHDRCNEGKINNTTWKEIYVTRADIDPDDAPDSQRSVDIEMWPETTFLTEVVGL